MTPLQEIEQFLVRTFTERDIEDTPTNRRDFLTGIRAAWEEDTSTNPNKEKYMRAINAEIEHQEMLLQTQ